jgi:hypothetical protein
MLLGKQSNAPAIAAGSSVKNPPPACIIWMSDGF